MVRIFGVPVSVRVLIVLTIDAVLLYASYASALLFVYGAAGPVVFWSEGGFLSVAVVALSFVLAMYYQDMYTTLTVPRIALLNHLATSAGVAFVVAGLAAYFFSDARLPLRLMLGGGALSTIALFAWRNVYRRLSHGLGEQSVLFVGANSAVRQIAENLRRRNVTEIRVLGYTGAADPNTTAAVGPCLGPLDRVAEIARSTRPDRVVVGLTEMRGNLPVSQLVDLRCDQFRVEHASSLFESVFGRVAVTDLPPSALIFSKGLRPRRTLLVRRDLYLLPLVLLATLASLPLMLLAAIAVKLSSPGPVLFRQKRVGLGGKVFTLYKFRSMYIDAEARTGAVWASKDDPRVTPVGKWLRRFRIDELPQFWNVLSGSMSLVGPRPERPEFVSILSQKIPYYPQRHSVRPGITGWAQINHKYGDTIEDSVIKLEYDLYYIKHLSISLDLYILFHTLKTMLQQKGAH